MKDTSEKQSQDSQNHNLQSNQVHISISSSVRQFVVLLLFIVSSETIIERGALQYVIKPFLYCDLFKASARAKKRKNFFVATSSACPLSSRRPSVAFISLDRFDHKSLQIVRTQIHSLKLSN